MKPTLFALFAALASLAGPALGQTGIARQPAIAQIEAPADAPFPGVLEIRVDATDLDRRIFRVHETIPVVGAGPMTLLFPQWVPGGHAPRNPLYAMAGLVIRSGGQLVPWLRDPVQVFAFHLTPPPGAKSLEVEFEFLSPTAADQGRVQMTPEMLSAQWITLALYPSGYVMRRIPAEAAIRLPEGWRYATALETAGTEDGLVRFKTVPFDVLLDSPLIAGRYFRQWDLDASGKAPVRLDVVADRPELLEATPAEIEGHRELVRQADKLFAPRHFDHYDFLLSLSDRLGGIGLEHHRSSEDGAGPEYFIGWTANAPSRNLLPHEYVHSWNGKFRRPADLWTPNLNVPMRDSLLWVYEGLTQYWGYVLGARSGLNTEQQTLDALAATAAAYSAGQPGRRWRSMEDTTNDPIVASRRPQPWASWQRSEDYYSEGQLVWLDADTLIREKTGGRKSLDDFARIFFGVRDGDYSEATYTLDDVVAALNAVLPYDWRTFFEERVNQVRPAFPLDGIARGGYRLVYTDTPTEFWRQSENSRKSTDLTYSLGLTLDAEGSVTDVLWDGPAYKAGLVVGAKVMAVDGVAYSADLLKAAIKNAKTGPAVTLIVKDGVHFKLTAIDYHGGLRYPRLERVPGAPDRLEEIYAAR